MAKVEQEETLMNYLINEMGRKRNDVKNLLKYGNVSVNGEVQTHHAFALHAGDDVQIGKPAHVSLPFPILYEDKQIIVIDKPSGLVSEETAHNHDKTAFAIVKNYLKAKREDIYLVHRLDQETSGVLMFVKNRTLYETLTHQWNTCVTKRGYIALVEGRLPKERGTIENYLAEGKSQQVYVAKGNQGKKAITHYQVLKTNRMYSMVEVFLDTGRKNQIRVHFSSVLHHPLVGDRKYGNTCDAARRLCLHAHVFAFKNPMTGEEMRFVSKTPEIFDKLMKKG